MEDERELMDEIIRDFPEIRLTIKIKNKKKFIDIQENNENDICSICRDDTNMKVSCNHYFHEECINEWINKSKNKLCPYCRRQLEFKIYGEKLINWGYFIEQDLTEEFIEKFQHKLNWFYISKKKYLSEKFIEKFQHKLNWKKISQHQKLSEEFIEKFQDKVDWINISTSQKLSEKFIEKFKDKVVWIKIFNHQKLSEEFKKRNMRNTL